MLKIGDKAPEFTLPDQDGKFVSLSNYKNQGLVIWFFPKASTPGWTNQGIGFRDELKNYEKLNFSVIGISADPPKRQKKFVEKYGFNYPLLCDESHNMLEEYGVWGLKKFMGREYMGINRVTYILNPNHTIKQIVDKVNTKSHACDLLEIIS